MTEVILIGDTGLIEVNYKDKLMMQLRERLPSSENSIIIILGDLIYPNGLPPHNSSKRKKAEAILNEYYALLKDFKGKILFISGNHDWNECKKDGYEYVIRLEEYLVNLFGNENILLPKQGFVGPDLVDISEELSIVVINSQWWLQDGYRPGDGDIKDVESIFFAKLNKMLYSRKDRQVIVVAHNPVYSYSVHGGKYKLQHHIFPFTIWKKNAWIPLPVIGSAISMYRKYLGAREDISNFRYKRFRNKLKLILNRYPGIIHACGHEHNLQHIKKQNVDYIVSGAGSKVKYVVKNGKYLKFGLNKLGYFKLNVHSKNNIDCECLAIKKNNKLETVYTGKLGLHNKGN